MTEAGQTDRGGTGTDRGRRNNPYCLAPPEGRQRWRGDRSVCLCTLFFAGHRYSPYDSGGDDSSIKLGCMLLQKAPSPLISPRLFITRFTRFPDSEGNIIPLSVHGRCTDETSVKVAAPSVHGTPHKNRWTLKPPFSYQAPDQQP
jgi:hypothetical protein